VSEIGELTSGAAARRCRCQCSGVQDPDRKPSDVTDALVAAPGIDNGYVLGFEGFNESFGPLQDAIDSLVPPPAEGPATPSDSG
jgi:hypothetical protein